MELQETPVIIIGGGGHAKVLASTLLLCGREVIGFADPNPTSADLLQIRHIGDDEAVLAFATARVRLVNGVGSVISAARRREIYLRFIRAEYVFASVIHPAATIAAGTLIEDGVQIMAGAIVQTGCRLGANVIVNTGARIDHDCIVHPHAHVAPGVTLCGGVEVGSESHVGAGATVIQGVRIGARSVVGAGAVVIRDVPPDATVVGVPANSIHERRTA